MLKQFITSALFAVGLSASAQGVYQFKDPGFENWKSTNEPGNGWNSFESAENNGIGNLFNTGKNASPKPTQETAAPHSGSKSLKIYSNTPFVGKKANGNITTGVIMMGSTNPVSDYNGERKNHNKTMRSKDGGYMLFDGTPDKISFYAKFKSGGSQNGSGRFILHGDVDYRDPDKQSNGEYFPDMKENLIGEATILVPATTDWTYFESDFTYYQSKPTKQYLLASLTTNPNPGESSGDELYVDDIQFIYYHGLSSLSYNNVKLAGFSEDKLNYDLSTEEYDETKVAYEIHGRGASAEKVYNKKTGVLTINVKGNDYAANESSITTYTIQFKHEIAKETVYKNSLLVDAHDLGGIQFTPSSPISVLHYESNNCYDLLLKDFSFGGMSVGDILVEELTPSTSVDGTLTLTAKDKSTSVTLYGEPAMLPITVDAQISKAGNMTATITIDLGEGMTVDVTYAPQLTISPSTSLEVSNATGLTNVVMNRTFTAGWNTYCMPFDYNLSSLDAEAKAQEFVSSNGSSLTFNEVADGVLKANVPYLVYFPTETKVGTTEAPLYFVTNVASYQPTSVEYNGFTFVGNYEASKSMEGLYGVASEGDVQKIMLGTAGSTLPATCAYFTTKNMNANGLRICFDGGEVTGINQVNGAQAQSAGAVYNLQGIKVSNHGTNNLPAGLYIMQGKKVIVK